MYTDVNIFAQGKAQADLSELEQRGLQILQESVIETANDDDIETDEDTLRGGIDQCVKDIHDLFRFVRDNPKFRAKTNVVDKWRTKGFWFSEDGRQHCCLKDDQFDCKKIF